MKATNLKKTFSLLTVIIITTTFLITGCSKQDNKETTSDNEQKTETAQQQNTMNNMQNDSSVKMNQDKMENMDMDKDSKSDSKGNIEHKMINIPTSQCEMCQERIEKALKKVAGVKNYKVDIDEKIVHVNFDKTVTNLGKIENAITAAGYNANNKKADPEAYAKLDDCCKLPQDRKKKDSN